MDHVHPDAIRVVHVWGAVTRQHPWQHTCCDWHRNALPICVPLARREGAFHERLARVAARVDDIDVHVRSLWDAALAAPVAREALWLHGDLHAQNVLVDGGRLSAVIDWGDVTAGDVATDLAGVWSIFDTPGARALALDRYGPDEATLARAKGWAVLFSIALIDAGSVDSPRHAAQGHALLSRLREGP